MFDIKEINFIVEFEENYYKIVLLISFDLKKNQL